MEHIEDSIEALERKVWREKYLYIPLSKLGVLLSLPSFLVHPFWSYATLFAFVTILAWILVFICSLKIIFISKEKINTLMEFHNE